MVENGTLVKDFSGLGVQSLGFGVWGLGLGVWGNQPGESRDSGTPLSDACVDAFGPQI